VCAVHWRYSTGDHTTHDVQYDQSRFNQAVQALQAAKAASVSYCERKFSYKCGASICWCAAQYVQIRSRGTSAYTSLGASWYILVWLMYY
jgi:hypothetical protein